MRLHADLILFESALSADHKTLIISVVNPTETAQECEVALSGVHPVGGTKLLRLTAPQGDTGIRGRIWIWPILRPSCKVIGEFVAANAGPNNATSRQHQCIRTGGEVITG